MSERRRGRRAVVVVAVVVLGLLAAGCADDETGTPGADPQAAEATTTTPGAPGGDATAPTTVPGPPGGPPPGPAAPPADTVVPPPSEPPAGWPAIDGHGRVGSFAPALLRPDHSGQLVVEVHAAEGADPRATTADHLQATLAAVSGKPVALTSGGRPDGEARAWTPAELAAAADAGARTPQGDGVAVIRLLFVHGTLEGDRGVLGVALRGDAAAVFVDRVEAAGGLLGGSSGIEVAVATHEIGHLLGLVDVYLDTGRADPEHPGHSRNERSVMYWAVESDLVGQLLGANPPRDFDDDDRADLAAIAAGA